MEIEYKDIDLNNKIIDIRSKLDYDCYSIKKSINIPYLKLLENHSKYLNKQDIYYLICDKGKISKSASRILNAIGYKCYSISGGIEEITK